MVAEIISEKVSRQPLSELPSTADSIARLMLDSPEPSQGLSDELFYFISRTTPLINVDLLIQDKLGRTLLSWRDDPYAGTGWHIPGGIVRFKEHLENRILKVAETELGAAVTFDPVPIAISQFIHEKTEVRGHFISLLFRCFLSPDFQPRNEGVTPEEHGYLAWHRNCPDNLISVHNVYRKFITVDVC